MNATEISPSYERLVILLDGCIDALDAAAEREKRQEAGKPLRKVTHQSRARAVREAVKAAAANIPVRHAPLWFDDEAA